MNRLNENWSYWKMQGWLDKNHKDFNSYGVYTKQQNQIRLIAKYNNFSNPFVYCRVVNPKDFEIHPEYSASQIMAGFDGEYYGLTDKDPESESYKILASFTKLIDNLGYKDVKIEVGKKIEKS